MTLLYNFYQQPLASILGLLVITLWALVWKGIALWHTAKNGQKRWFIFILILNTLGLLPIIYLIWFKPEEKVEEKGKRRSGRKKTGKKIMK